MARTGGRSTGFAWFVGVVIAVVVGALVWFAIPAFPSVAVWVGDQVRNATGAGVPAAGEEPSPAPSSTETPAAPVVPDDCRALYPDALWALLTSTAGSELTEQTTLPADGAELAAALGAGDPLVCRWSIPTGPSITTVVAAVDADAPDAGATYLGARRYSCTVDGVRTACSLDDDGVVTTHEVRDGLWVMTVLDGWRPPRYAEDVVAQVWP